MKRSSTPQKHFLVAVSLVATLLGTPSVFAADGTWQGSSLGPVGAGSAWGNATNWSGGTVPGATSGTTNTDTATFNVAGTWTVAATANLNIGNLTFGTLGAAPNYYMITAGSSLLTSNNALIQADNTFRGNVGIAGPNAGIAITMQGNLTLRNNGLVGSSMAFNTISTAASLGAVNLTLEGSNSGLTSAFGSRANGIISQGSGTTLSLVKNGTGTWTVSGANTYTGGTTINGGTIITGNAAALGSTGNITIAGNSTIRAATTLTDPSARILINDGVTLTYDTAGNNPTWTGVLQNSGGLNTAGLTKTGLNSLILQTGANSQTYRGATTVNMGTLTVNSLTSNTSTVTNTINSNSALVLGGGNLNMRAGTQSTATTGSGTSLTISGNNTSILVGALVTGTNIAPGTTVSAVTGTAVTLSQALTGTPSGTVSFGATTLNQTFNGTTLNAGISQFIPASNAGTNVIDFGAITRNRGSLLNITTANGYTFNATGTTNNAGGVVKGVIFSSNDFARINTNTFAAATYTTQNAAGSWTSNTTNYVTNGAVTGSTASGATINALKLNAAASQNITITDTLTVNDGILFGSTIGANNSTISGGTLTSGSGDLIIVNNNAQAVFGRNTITSTIVDNGGGATNVVLYSPAAGMLYLGGNNTYTGNTYIGGGFNAATATAGVTVGGAAGARIGSGNATVFLNGGTGGNTNVLRVGNGDATGDILGTVQVDNGRLALNRNDTFTLSAAVTGSAGGGFIFQEGTGTGTINFASGNNFFSGLGNIGAGGTLILQGANSVNNFQTQNWANTTGFVPTSITTFSSGTYNFSAPGNAGTNGVGTWNLNGATVVTGGRYFAAGGGTVNLNAGTLRFNGDSLESGAQSTGNIAFNISGGNLYAPAVSNSGGTASWAIGSGVSATGNYIVTQSGGEVSVGMPENATSLSTVGSQNIVIGPASDAAANTNTYALSGGILRAVGGITSGGAAFGAGSHNFNWTGGRLTTFSYNGTNIRSNNGINSGTGTLFQGGSTSIMSPGETHEGTLFTGRTAITGGYQIDAGTVAIGIGGTTAATVFHNTSNGTYDQITVSGATVLGGRLALALNNGYTPPNDTSTKFNILVGSASGVTGNFTNQQVATSGNSRVVLADGLSSFLIATNNTAAAATTGGLTSVGARTTAVGGYQATNTYSGAGTAWDTVSAGAWTNFDAGATATPATQASGAIAQFADGTASTGAIGVSLNSTRNIQGIQFSSAAGSRAYTISNGGSGALILDNTANNASATIADTSTSGTANAINVPITLNSNLAASVTNAANTLTIGGDISGSGRSLTKLGAGTLALSGTNTYTGTTTVAAGTLLANTDKSLGNTSGVTVNGGILDIRGTSAGTVTLGTAANFSMSSGSIRLNLLTPGTSDVIVSSGLGAFTLTGGSLILDVTDIGFDYNSSYAVFSGFGGTNTISGLSITGYDTAGYTAALGTTGIISFVVIPEPSTVAFVGIALIGMILLRRRKQRA